MLTSRLFHFFLLTAVTILVSCSASRKIDRSAQSLVLKKEGILNAHVGISIFDPATNTYLYKHQADKYFVPASNTKLFTMYAALKYLGDSIVGMRYHETADSIYLQPAGDPTFLHPDFVNQPLVKWLQKTNKELVISDANFTDKELGFGWAWDDFNSGYMAERSPLPIYGNVIKWTQVIEKAEDQSGKPTDNAFVFSEPEISWKVNFNPAKSDRFNVIRERNSNIFYITEGKEILNTRDVPFVTNGVLSALDLLRDTIGRSVLYVPAGSTKAPTAFKHSQLRDSLLAIMMHRSDNFFAEQVLLMCSQQLFGVMNTGKIIDTLLKGDLHNMPQEAKWVDGSGLSRYNQFTPNSIIWLLQEMEKLASRQQIQAILPGANEGTLAGYYKEMPGAIYAKTGTLSGHLALSGYLTTRKNRRLLFSVMVNNHNSSAVTIRRSVEAFLKEIYQKY